MGKASSGAAARAEKLAGSVPTLVGAPGTASTRLTNVAAFAFVPWTLELGSCVPARSASNLSVPGGTVSFFVSLDASGAELPGAGSAMTPFCSNSHWLTVSHLPASFAACTLAPGEAEDGFALLMVVAFWIFARRATEGDICSFEMRGYHDECRRLAGFRPHRTPPARALPQSCKPGCWKRERVEMQSSAQQQSPPKRAAPLLGQHITTDNSLSDSCVVHRSSHGSGNSRSHALSLWITFGRAWGCCREVKLKGEITNSA